MCKEARQVHHPKKPKPEQLTIMNYKSKKLR